MVVHFKVFTASNNLEGFHVSLHICCTDRVSVHVCICCVWASSKERERESVNLRRFIDENDQRATSSVLGLISWNPSSFLKSDHINTSLNGVVENKMQNDAMCRKTLFSFVLFCSLLLLLFFFYPWSPFGLCFIYFWHISAWSTIECISKIT